MWPRILKVLSIGVKHSHDSMVLGAWGCGAFGNDSDEIAALFCRALERNFKGAYRRSFLPFSTGLGTENYRSVSGDFQVRLT